MTIKAISYKTFTVTTQSSLTGDLNQFPITVRSSHPKQELKDTLQQTWARGNDETFDDWIGPSLSINDLITIFEPLFKERMTLIGRFVVAPVGFPALIPSSSTLSS